MDTPEFRPAGEAVALPVGRGRRLVPPVVRIALVGAALAAVVGALWLLHGGLAPADGAPRIGSPAPTFTLTNANGQSVTLAQYRGKTVLINFWATWCPPCRAEMPAIDRVAGHDPRVVVLAVDVDEGPLLVQRYLQSTKLSFVPLLDEDGSVTGRYHVNGLPSSFFIGPDGTIRAINIGPMDQATVRLNLQRAS